MKVLILICLSTLPRGDCQPETAIAVIDGPEARNELMCSLHGQAYLAESALAQSRGPQPVVG